MNTLPRSRVSIVIQVGAFGGITSGGDILVFDSPKADGILSFDRPKADDRRGNNIPRDNWILLYADSKYDRTSGPEFKPLDSCSIDIKCAALRSIPQLVEAMAAQLKRQTKTVNSVVSSFNQWLAEQKTQTPTEKP